MALHTPKFGLPAKKIVPGQFQHEQHYYPRVLNAQLHPLVAYFLNMTTEQLISRYCHLNPQVEAATLSAILGYTPLAYPWAGADLFNVTTPQGTRRMALIELNSSPSGQKSMPLLDERQEQGGYRPLMQKTFKPRVEKSPVEGGGLAVLYDKNPMETVAYAKVMADVFDEPVWAVEFYEGDPDPSARFSDGVLEVRDEEGTWHPIRGAFRYVTQKPWNRIPAITKTVILNPILACLCGGRNKLIAAKAYEAYNQELTDSGLQIRTPYTIRDVRKVQVPLWIRSMGGRGVVKVPYSNAGQGVYTIVTKDELDKFMERDFHYDEFIVQSLIGNHTWSSKTREGQFFHVGTVPDKKCDIYVSDLRMMIHHTPEGFRPLALYARKARTPLAEDISDSTNSWEMLGTNLSVKTADGSWDSEAERLLLMDNKDFNRLGLGLDDLIEGFVQSALGTIAIDKIAAGMISSKTGKFRRKLYKSLNNDEVLLKEIME